MALKTCFGVFNNAYLRRLKSKAPVSVVDVYIAMQSIDVSMLKVSLFLAGNPSISKSEINRLPLCLADVIGYTLFSLVESTEHKNFSQETVDAINMQYRKLIFDAGCADDIHSMLKKPKQYPNTTLTLLNLLKSSRDMCADIHMVLIKNIKIDLTEILGASHATT